MILQGRKSCSLSLPPRAPPLHPVLLLGVAVSVLVLMIAFVFPRFAELFDTLDWLEDRLSRHRYLAGDTITEADWRLFTTLLRFDPVYHVHFKCNRNRLVDYPNLWAYTRELYQYEGVAETINMHHIKNHYYVSHKTINPSGVVPVGPEQDLSTPHGREKL